MCLFFLSLPIGSSLGAYVAAVYASKPENQKDVDRVMLLAPTFKLEEAMERLEEEVGVSLSTAFKEDAAKHPAFPFVKCRAYVVHGGGGERGGGVLHFTTLHHTTPHCTRLETRDSRWTNRGVTRLETDQSRDSDELKGHAGVETRDRFYFFRAFTRLDSTGSFIGDATCSICSRLPRMSIR